MTDIYYFKPQTFAYISSVYRRFLSNIYFIAVKKVEILITSLFYL